MHVYIESCNVNLPLFSLYKQIKLFVLYFAIEMFQLGLLLSTEAIIEIANDSKDNLWMVENSEEGNVRPWQKLSICLRQKVTDELLRPYVLRRSSFQNFLRQAAKLVGNLRKKGDCKY